MVTYEALFMFCSLIVSILVLVVSVQNKRK